MRDLAAEVALLYEDACCLTLGCWSARVLIFVSLELWAFAYDSSLALVLIVSLPPPRLFTMSLLKTVTAGLAFVALSVHAAETSADDMGPAAFMWPPDRVWSAAMDNTAPCGSVAGVTNRTDFPMSMTFFCFCRKKKVVILITDFDL